MVPPPLALSPRGVLAPAAPPAPGPRARRGQSPAPPGPCRPGRSRRGRPRPRGARAPGLHGPGLGSLPRGQRPSRSRPGRARDPGPVSRRRDDGARGRARPRADAPRGAGRARGAAPPPRWVLGARGRLGPRGRCALPAGGGGVRHPGQRGAPGRARGSGPDRSGRGGGAPTGPARRAPDPGTQRRDRGGAGMSTGSAPRVAVTRDEQPGGALSLALRRNGLEPVPCPVLSHLAPHDPGALHRALERLEEYDWIVVTSARTVEVLVRTRAPRPLPEPPPWGAGS